MTLKQVPSNLPDRQLWGRMVDGYAGATGTGCKLLDPQAKEVYSDGALYMMMRLEVYETRDLFQLHAIPTKELDGALEASGQARPTLQSKGLQIHRGFWRGVIWAGFISIIAGGRQFNLGWLAGKDIPALFAAFDGWKAGHRKALRDVDVAVQSI